MEVLTIVHRFLLNYMASLLRVHTLFCYRNKDNIIKVLNWLICPCICLCHSWLAFLY